MKLDVFTLKTRTFWWLLFAAFAFIGIAKNLVELCVNFAR